MLRHFLNVTNYDQEPVLLSRRRFLQRLAVGTVLTGIGLNTAQAKVHHVLHHHKAKLHKTHARRHYLHRNSKPLTPINLDTNISHKTLALNNINTGEQLNLTYFEHGEYIPEALHEINYLCRDYHTDSIRPVDPDLLDQLYDLKRMLSVNRSFQVISAYRSPDTNASLRHQSHRVAKHSLHMEGRAIDIRVEGFATHHIKNAAMSLQRGGVGYYPAADFVHMDTGEFRTW